MYAHRRSLPPSSAGAAGSHRDTSRQSLAALDSLDATVNNFSAAGGGGGAGTSAVGGGAAVVPSGGGPSPSPSMPLPHRVAVDPTGTFVAICSPGATKVQLYKVIVRDPSSSSSDSEEEGDSDGHSSSSSSRSDTDDDDGDDGYSDGSSQFSSSSYDSDEEDDGDGVARCPHRVAADARRATAAAGEGALPRTLAAPFHSLAGADRSQQRKKRSGSNCGAPVAFQFVCESADAVLGVIEIGWAHPSAGTVLAVSCRDMSIHVLRLSRAPDGAAALVSVANNSRALFSLEKDIALALAFPPVYRRVPLLAIGLNNGVLGLMSLGTAKREAAVALGDAALGPGEGAAETFVVSAGGSQVSKLNSTTNAASLAASAETGRGPPITALAWSPSAAESCSVLAAGFANGVCLVARIDHTYTILLRLDALTGAPRAGPSAASAVPSAAAVTAGGGIVSAPVTSIAWAPALGRRHHSIAMCCEGNVAIATVAPVMGALRRDPSLFTAASVPLVGSCLRTGLGAARLAWASNGDQLIATCAGNTTAVFSKTALGDHLSWEVTASL